MVIDQLGSTEVEMALHAVSNWEVTSRPIGLGHLQEQNFDHLTQASTGRKAQTPSFSVDIDLTMPILPDSWTVSLSFGSNDVGPWQPASFINLRRLSLKLASE